MTSEEEHRGFNPPQTSRIWRDRLLPRSVLPLFWIAWVLVLPARFLRKPRRVTDTPRRVAIESGIIGWTHVYFEELFASAQEVYGTSSVIKQVIDRDLPCVPQMRANMRRDQPTHVVLDVRTPGQTWVKSWWHGLRTTWFLTRRRITPIVVLTDAFYRRQRWHAAVLTAFSGVVVTFANAEILRPIFPHRRLIGPIPMPISVDRLEWLERERANRVPETEPRVQFIGSVYPPRDRFLSEVEERLADSHITLRVNRDKAGTSNEDYWRTLLAADIVVTTTLQGPPRPFMDWIWVQQAVFRFAEATAAGAALVSAPVDGGFPYFVKNRDYLEFVSVDDAVNRVKELYASTDKRREIAAHGHHTSSKHIREHAFWRAIDEVLNKK